MSVPEIARRWIGGRWQTGVAEDPSGGSQPLRIETLQLTYADFSIVDPNGGFFAAAYTLQPGEALLFTLARVTELFDDSTAGSFGLYDAPDTGIADQIGLSNGNVSPDVPIPSNGIVALTGDTVGSNFWSSVDSPYAVETVAVPLFVGNAFTGDGTTGALTLWFYIGTP